MIAKLTKLNHKRKLWESYIDQGWSGIHTGLEEIGMGELVYLPDKNIYGSALNLENDQIGAIIFGEESKVSQGDTVVRTDRLVSVPCGAKLLGRVVNSLGIFIDGKDKTPDELKETPMEPSDIMDENTLYEQITNAQVGIYMEMPNSIKDIDYGINKDEEYPTRGTFAEAQAAMAKSQGIGESEDVAESEGDALIHMNIERKAPGVITRLSVSEPLLTGYKIVDGLLPIGRGQRELIIGDRQTGKTTIGMMPY